MCWVWFVVCLVVVYVVGVGVYVFVVQIITYCLVCGDWLIVVLELVVVGLGVGLGGCLIVVFV